MCIVQFRGLRSRWNIRKTVVDAFATSFFLSHTKILSVSVDLLLPVRIYTVGENGSNHTLHVYYAAELEYFGKDHRPFAILAILVLCLLVLLPALVLMLYPFSFFQKLLHLFPFRWHILHTFVDSFYRCYKDGTQPGTRDYRWFVAVFFLFRVFQYLLYLYFSNAVSAILVILSLLLHTGLLAVMKPFSSAYAHFNTFNIIFLHLLTALAVTGFGIYALPYMSPLFPVTLLIVGGVLVFFPVLCMSGGILYCAYKNWRFGRVLVQRVKAKMRGYKLLAEEPESLPHRMEQSITYPRSNPFYIFS